MFITVVVIVILVVGAIGTIYRQRKGGPGPAINGWVPKWYRPRMNRQYREQGWQEPFAEDGERNPDRDAL